MKHHTREEISRLVDRHAFIPLFNPDQFEQCFDVLRAAYDGGVRLFECTNRTPQALDIFRRLAPAVEKEMPGLVLGAGTIMDAAAAAAFYEAGAQFIVSPVINSDVGDYCRQHDLFWCPGAATLNEIMQAQNAGADLVKIFPANFIGGPDFVRAILAPCPGLRLMPTGGVDRTPENIKDWFDAGVICVGIGSKLFSKNLLHARNYSEITARTREIVDLIQDIRAKTST